MILVATGTHDKGFDRLIKAIDMLAQQGCIKDVFIQIGCSRYEPKYCTWKRTVEFDEFETLFDKADLIISHGGAGSIAGALERGKPLIVVPRRKKYNEHTNDHQLELAWALEKSKRAIVIYEIEELSSALDRIKLFQPPLNYGTNRIVELVSNFLQGPIRVNVK